MLSTSVFCGLHSTCELEAQCAWMDSVAELNALGSEVQILPSPCIGCMSLRDLASRRVLTAE